MTDPRCQHRLFNGTTCRRPATHLAQFDGDTPDDAWTVCGRHARDLMDDVDNPIAMTITSLSGGDPIEAKGDRA